MAKGKFQKKRQNNIVALAVGICAVIVALCLLGILYLQLTRNNDGNTDPQTPVSSTSGMANTLPGTTAPMQTTGNTSAPNEATTAPTEEATEPTEEVTEPTEEVTEPTEEVTEPTEQETVPEDEEKSFGQAVAQLALAQVGKPYLHGGTGPDSFDTSGLVYYCFKENGLSVSRLVKGLTEGGQEVAKDQLQPGDVVFFWTENEGEAEYVGIYTGNGKFVAARNGDKPVTEMDLTGSYFSQRFVCARRYEPENKD